MKLFDTLYTNNESFDDSLGNRLFPPTHQYNINYRDNILNKINCVSKYNGFNKILNISKYNKYYKEYYLTKLVYQWKYNKKMYPNATIDLHFIDCCPDHLNIRLNNYKFIALWLNIVRRKNNYLNRFNNDENNVIDYLTVSKYTIRILLKKLDKYVHTKFMAHYNIEQVYYKESFNSKTRTIINAYIMLFTYFYPYSSIKYIVNKILDKLYYHRYINSTNYIINEIKPKTNLYDILNKFTIDEFVLYGF